jgi:redox-sensitive bicupin YhaK (pirin superfamily)
MPAITVEDPLTLPAVAEPLPDSVERPVVSLTTAPSGYEGEGFPVRRAFAGAPQRLLDPFIHMDQMGEVDYAPGEPRGTAWHPHRGFETVTYMIDGTFEHEDSTGGGGVITNGDTQWMTAGSGILHIERPPEALVTSGGLFHGVQLWVNLPAADKFVDPRYQDIGGGQVTLLRSPDGGVLLRLIAGSFGDHEGPGLTHTPITYVHATLAPGGDGDHVVLSADREQDSHTPNLEVLLLGGRPIREPVAAYGPFVMNTRAELVEAVEDFQAGRMGQVPAHRADDPQ